MNRPNPDDVSKYTQDNQDIVAELKYHGARLDADEEGWIWRVFLYKHKEVDELLGRFKLLPKLTEVWLVGTSPSPEAVEKLKEEMPELKILL